MREDSLKAKQLLQEESCTLVMCKADTVIKSFERGVKPLLELIESKNNYKGFCAADKVVGKAAAFLYVMLGVEEVYAHVFSSPAAEVLKKNGISYFAETIVPAIENRSKTGFCPMETAVMNISSANDALPAIKQKLASMQKNAAK